MKIIQVFECCRAAVRSSRLSSQTLWPALEYQMKFVTRKSYGFRTQNGYQTALYHTLGDLPEPETTHKFC